MAMIQAAENTSTLGRAYNISDGTGTTWGEYTNALADALGCKRPWLRLPFSAAMAVAPGMEAVQRTLGLPGRPLLTRHAVHLLGQDQEYPAARARADFGFTPQVSFAEGMARSAEWVRAQESGGL
jgi:nucleoside-diphosphate-sugar epimerase